MQRTMPRPRGWAIRRLVGGRAVFGWLWGGAAQAALLTFTDQGMFQMAISGYVGQTTLDFENPLAAGTMLMSGDSAEGITFTFDLGGLDVIVRDQTSPTFNTTSSTQYLGLDGGVDQLFSSGDALMLGFSGPRHAVGLFVVGTPGDVQPPGVQPGELTLSVSTGSVLSDSPSMPPLPDGGEAFFLGLVETDSTMGFTSATLTSLGDIGDPTFFWHLDDITTAQAPTGPPPTVIPEPGTLVLLGTGVVGLVCWRRKRVVQSRRTAAA